MSTPSSQKRSSYADVVVNVAGARGHTSFHYAVPAGVQLEIGQLVLVPFGTRRAQGIVVGLPETTDVDNVKEICAIADMRPALPKTHVELARWIAETYCCTLLQALLLMLPPGLRQKTLATLALNEGQPVPEDLTPRQRALVVLIRERGRIRLAQAKALLRWRDFDGIVAPLVRRHVIVRGSELAEPTAKPKVEQLVRLSPDWRGDPRTERQRQRAFHQKAVMEFLSDSSESQPQGTATPVREVYTQTGVDSAVVKRLGQKGWLELDEREVLRDPLAHLAFLLAEPPILTALQQQVWEEIQQALANHQPIVFLLHGITGSGKTEIYLRAIQDVLQRGQQAIVLVPEISLTPQTVHRFASRFPGRVAVLHSQLSAGERYDQWRQVRDGAFDVVIGSRSAVFAPLSRLGLIVVDEEHETSYKQERTPRYHAREVAIHLARLAGAQVILGSATPDLATYQHALQGRYRLLRLAERVHRQPRKGEDATVPSTEVIPLPPVQIVDMRGELRAGNSDIFSRALRAAVSSTLAQHEQVILFLNRRGTAAFVTCCDCGYVLKCRRCDVAVVYHGAEEELLCHQCNYRTPPPALCPFCQGGRLKFLGMGTQRVEAEVKRLFPRVRVLRWDRDATRGRHAHEQILYHFAQHQADVLVGTQMVAKGLDLPLVTLVGVISADTVLHLPDFRAAERTFQLLTQVAGRAGRGAAGGKVIIQTYTPEHYCIQAASRHDYADFFEQEMAFRREHAYPPYSRLAKLTCGGSSEAHARREAEEVAQQLREETARRGLPGTVVLGPTPAYHRRVRGQYRWHILIRGPEPATLLEGIALPAGWAVDMDPVSTL